ncbi:MAG TPA: hypothetical protein VFR68_02225, partial [Candidatus Dormibacteraeota bacterium]|nr:hypothetical protein [Candidatus Dormibacteraeota bacterium]
NAPVPINFSLPAGPPVLEEPKFTFVRPDSGEEETPAGPRRGKRGAAAEASSKPVGLRGPAGDGRLKPGEPASKPGAPVEQDETVRVGKERQPGRIFRIRGVNRS